MPEKQRYSKIWNAVFVLLAANLAVWSGVIARNPREFATVNFFDVGQGDSIYIRTVQGNDILIDGGPGDAVLGKLGRDLPYGDRQIEMVIITHPHADHVSGVVEVLRRFTVKKVLLSDVAYSSETYKTLLEILEQKQIPVVRPKLGQRIYLDHHTVMDVLYPVAGDKMQTPEDVNEASTIARLSVGKSHVLFTGDAGKSQETLLTRLGLPLQAQVLKVGHQGSKTSSAPEFLAAVNPDYGVIMVGKNNYGHPHEITLETLGLQQISVLRTDEKGDISFRIYPDRVLLND
ncbi:MAG: hypothetical protein A3C85_02000 [Candidatus Doudnabacteria bacterium RIFCSPHIGHO2_02_FULL_48_21]|uniref:Metallo-beta-lactamase domain-containing protein n=1 Tax=Candidatus Doudnabacteria bacterium RIFCSPLOWO2_02_FULL_48_13 TaxID=1817845 RepID=A0A1F5Q8N6_9BACT|nr:MAG: hypothetical protein A3K05_02205 [Candidatus Doudnabacteria bacterium RIFCSPHIGHO2_01_48_18]OGE79847.1 MAG: hypothetical protein A2668_03765 [Candidatus Doudnabacteria bacterium RIFCSPHIGHO2_01_FULL_48_180]OGE91386.1 MAG: hypothetical protein A3F44_03755 [Candidatus Doudnabacteria bacterium RIFCSPHIGHO2_12_FULL_47_25]OGE93198.1 MAG: hypothetical protein A3C85_02000 [Candidatus Doudnabacteria bacterium RIFCSPHIGHO2_02_FULL_48_21]OGE96719.1 MAG: hypothetical protein A3A83_02875 [Candidatu